MNKNDTKKLIKLYEKLCPGDNVCDDDPRLESIALELLEISKAKTIEDAMKVIEWWYNPEEWTRWFCVLVRKSVKRMKLSEE